MDRILETFKIKPGEERISALLVGLMLITAAGGTIGGIATEALFFARFGVEFLPNMYVILGLFTFVTSMAITIIMGRFSKQKLFIALPLIIGFALIAERVILLLNVKWFFAAMWLGMNVINGLQGLSVDSAGVKIVLNSKLSAQNSPLLITHWGLSGPAILKLSAFAARELAALDYKFEIEVNWCGKNFTEVKDTLLYFKKNNGRKNVAANPLFGIPKRLWERMLTVGRQSLTANFADLSNAQIDSLTSTLTASRFKVNGKSTFKDEFVTAGGVNLSEVDFKTMQSKKIPGLYFAGEVLDIDAITGGFNFQAAWTTAWIAANHI